MTDNQAVELLRQDMEAEHQAILQYLLVAWSIEGMEASIVEIARDEMRHFKWFAHAVVSLGGEPNMKVPEIAPVGDPIATLKHLATMEQDAADMYDRHIAAIQDSHLKVLLERIKGDELHHKKAFEKLVDKAQLLAEAGSLEVAELDKSPDPRKRLLWRYLQEDISGEYNAILRYLHQSFVVKDGWLADGLEDHAIDEMRHMGWMSEETLESGGEPDLRPDPVHYTHDLQEILTGNARLEHAAEERYDRHIEGYDDEELQELWRYIGFQETHHAAEFENRIGKLSTSDTQSAGTVSSDTPAPKDSTVEKKQPGERSDRKPSVGSLYRKDRK